MSDHYLVEARVLVAKGWFRGVTRSKREVIKIEELRKPEVKREYKRKVEAAYGGVRGKAVRDVEEE